MMILETFPSGPLETNAYLLGCSETKQAVIIDAPQGCVGPILQQLKAHSLTVTGILLTHSHWDHTADVATLKEKLQASIYIHPEDLGNLTHPGSDRLPMMFSILPANAEHLLTDGQKIAVGNLSIEVICTPGHTPGGVCFYLPREKTLFSGDTLFQGGIGNLSFPTARPELMWQSLKRLAKLPLDTTVYPGHGDPTTIGDEQWIVNAKHRYNDF
jgi:hydroxyacylglutathione hydrolase